MNWSVSVQFDAFTNLPILSCKPPPICMYVYMYVCIYITYDWHTYCLFKFQPDTVSASFKFQPDTVSASFKFQPDSKAKGNIFGYFFFVFSYYFLLLLFLVCSNTLCWLIDSDLFWWKLCWAFINNVVS